MNRTRPAGDAGLLIETDEQPAALAAAITRAAIPGVIDVVPGACTVLVIAEPGGWDPAELASVIGQLPAGDSSAGDGTEIQIPAVYDGPDLADVARLSGLSVGDVTEAHSRAAYTVGWLGFAPGFGYLTGLDPMLAGVPRLPSPRVSVLAGSVAIAGGMSAVYPSASPGGWRLIGHTTTKMWDPGREPPAVLAPGQRVRFIPQPGGSGNSAAETAEEADADQSAPVDTAAPGQPYLEVVRPGPLATVQDLGRHGYGAVGVPPAGAADARSLAAANVLAANPPGAAGIELTLGRAEFRCTGGCTLAVTGAPVDVTLRARDGGQVSQQPFAAAFVVPDGGVISIGPPATGLRSYLGVSGGVTTRAELGSRSADLHSGLGGPLQAGAILPIGQPRPAHAGRQESKAVRTSIGAGPSPGTGPQPQRPARFPARGDLNSLRIMLGPRTDWFAPDAVATLVRSSYTVGAASNRTGLRLDGEALARSSEAELPSEGVVTGSLQVPHDGKPILLLTDHPTVGGYPVIAVVVSADVGVAAQLRPGDRIAFTVTSIAEAVASAADSPVGRLDVVG
ncbi:MAG: 5-oxoprolinase/urea amidolyase family protein [Streptosporangiaceae bacterium]